MAAPEPPEETLRIAPMDGTYSTLRPSNKEIPRLHVIKKDGAVATFQYMYLDAKSMYLGGAFTFVFAGANNGN